MVWVQLCMDLSSSYSTWSSTLWTPSRETSTLTLCLCTVPPRYRIVSILADIYSAAEHAARPVCIKLLVLVKRDSGYMMKQRK